MSKPAISLALQMTYLGATNGTFLKTPVINEVKSGCPVTSALYIVHVIHDNDYHI